MKTLTKEQQKMITPEMAINLLKKGNERFINNLRINRNLLQQVDETSDGQNPFAVIISCMDSRTSPELIFDQGLGDIFSLRVAGNVINEDIIGSSEFGCKLVGAKVILVLGHTQCGAIKGAVQNVSLGHLEFITSKIRRSFDNLGVHKDASEAEVCHSVTRNNVFQSIEDLRNHSPILREMEAKNEIQIVGGLYDVASGLVDFFSGEDKDDSDFKPERNISPKNVALWLTSAFKAGFLNSAGFLITGKFVSHVTGFGTQAGMAIGHEDFFFGIELLFIPLSFILGGTATAYLLEKNADDDKNPRYYIVQALVTLLLAVIIATGESLAKERTPFDFDNNYNILELFIISCLCFTCGLKNGLVTWTTYGKIRVTHLTGLSTDIGLNLLKTLNPNWRSTRFKEERKVNIIRMLIFLSFTSGAIVSALVIPELGFQGFTIAFAISLILTVISIRDYRCVKQEETKGLTA